MIEKYSQNIKMMNRRAGHASTKRSGWIEARILCKLEMFCEVPTKYSQNMKMMNKTSRVRFQQEGVGRLKRGSCAS